MKTFVLCLLLSATLTLHAKTWQVGPTRQYKMPSQVMSLVASGDTVLIDSGLYVKDVGVWRASRLVLKCAVGYAHLDAQGTAAAHKGIWVIDGDSAYVEGIEFSGCAISYNDGNNGAGIRFESHMLECRRCYFHDNQEGILTGNDTTNVITIEACKFDHNGVETGLAAGFEHNIYVGHSSVCTIKFCYFHGSIVGHEIKSRANRNYILYNYIVDGPDGDGSYSIDLPNGGMADILGNIIEKGPKTENSTVVSYGEEGLINPERYFFFGSNTVVTDRQPTTFLHVAAGTTTSLMINNIFAGGTNLGFTAVLFRSNQVAADTAHFHFRDPRTYDYHVTEPFSGCDSITILGSTGYPVYVWPQSEYVHPMDSADISNSPNYIGALRPVFAAGVLQHSDILQSSNHPNPFSLETRIDVSTIGGPVELSVYNSIGQLVWHGEQYPERGSITFERGLLPAGVYHYIVTSASGDSSRGSMVIE